MNSVASERKMAKRRGGEKGDVLPHSLCAGQDEVEAIPPVSVGDKPNAPPQPERDSGRLPTRNARSARTREALRASFLRLLEQVPLEEVTIRDIAAGAATSYATFFRHYTDKDALLDDVAAEQISRLLAMTLPLLFSVDSRASARALCAYVWEHRTIWTVLLTGGASSVLKKEFIRQAREIAAKAGEQDSRIPNDLRVVFCVSGTLEILAWWLEHGEDLSVDRMAEIQDILGVAPHVPSRPPAAVVPPGPLRRVSRDRHSAHPDHA